MSRIGRAITEINTIDELAGRDQWVNRIHPLVKFACTVIFIIVTVSFHKYDIIGLLPMILYPFILFQAADLSFWQCLRRIWVVLPFVCLIGLFNPFFDRVPVPFGNVIVPAGLISMVTLIIKGILTVTASYLLAATTRMEDICQALAMIHVPGIIVTEILLIRRYITLLLEETGRTVLAYQLRAPGEKGVRFRVWGSLAGQLLLRSVDRAKTVYESMCLRGYDGTGFTGVAPERIGMADICYAVFFAGMFILIRTFPVLVLIGNIIIH